MFAEIKNDYYIQQCPDSINLNCWGKRNMVTKKLSCKIKKYKLREYKSRQFRKNINRSIEK